MSSTELIDLDALKQSEARFRAIAEASPAAIFIAQNARISYANATLAALTGRDARDLIGLDPMDLVHPSHRESALARREARLRGEEVEAHFEVRIDTCNGEECWLDLTTAQIVYEGGAAVVGTGIDITARKRLEVRMQQAQRLEALGRLAGGVAHDFNNLLTVITGQTEQLLDGLATGHALRSSAAAIAEAAERATALTQHLLAFGRRQMMIARPVDINEVVSDLQGILGGAPSRAAVHLTPGLPRVSVDRARLEQALINLVANARDALGEQGSLTIATDLVDVDAAMREGRPWLPRATFVRLQVTDTGAGIPADVLPHVFEPFFSTKSAGPACGLGLSTVYGIVKQSAGYVWIDSEPGSGTRVTVLLPPVKDASPARMEEPPLAASSRVLLVEDEDGVRELLGRMLERNGFVVRTARSAEDALEILRDATFDVLLTDVMLPGMRGPDLARHARLIAPGLRVLFMSGYTGDVAAEASDMVDERSFIQKPFGSRALVARLRSLLGDSA